MRIGELSRRTGVSVRALRYYEEQGILSPDRRPSGYREFNAQDVVRVEHTRNLLRAGIGTSLISRIVGCMQDGELLLEDCREQLLVERRRIDQDLRTIGAARDALDALLDGTVSS